MTRLTDSYIESLMPSDTEIEAMVARDRATFRANPLATAARDMAEAIRKISAVFNPDTANLTMPQIIALSQAQQAALAYHQMYLET